MAVSRRTLLCSAGGTLGLLTAGCLDDASTADDDTGEPSTDDDSNGTNEINGDVNELDAHEAVSFRHNSIPMEPTATLIGTPDVATAWLEDRSLEETDSDEVDLNAFVDETDFSESLIVAVEANGPDLCHELALDAIGVTESDGEVDPRLILEAGIRDETDDGETCAQQVTAVSLFVRATPPIDSVTAATVTVVDTDGREYDIETTLENGGTTADDSDDGEDDASTD